MRFFADGPNIPDQLLQRRDDGLVVFLCGAGVSMDAGLPSFENLTKNIVEIFDPPENSDIAKAYAGSDKGRWTEPIKPLDQIFQLLHTTYGPNRVNVEVARQLATDPRNVSESKNHELIARISCDKTGTPQIVTTNFDRLFDNVPNCKQADIHEPPGLPHVEWGASISGVTYLHGRLKEQGTQNNQLILSRPDFGRAYLAQGWATHFMRSLLEAYTVVLVGYQANDPPLNYLLHGLHQTEFSRLRSIYAFDRGAQTDIEAKWREAGATAIGYPDHPDLWKSFEEWAERADDPRKWRQTIVDLAANDPKQLEAHQRGQVAHLVRSVDGAELFAKADPPPHAEWLCVFDAGCRAGDTISGAHGEIFDPLSVYGLDDDPPRPAKSKSSQPDTNEGEDHPSLLDQSDAGEKDEEEQKYDNLLKWRSTDEHPTDFHHPVGQQTEEYEVLPSRLRYLTQWITSQLDRPVTAWWVARQPELFRLLTPKFERELDLKSGLLAKARQIWQLILEFQSDPSSLTSDERWFNVAVRIKTEGWTPSVLRAFEQATRPRLSTESLRGLGQSKPPEGNWDEMKLGSIANWDVKFPHLHAEEYEVSVPSRVLEDVFRIAVTNLLVGSALLQSIDPDYIQTPTCYPDTNEDIGEHYNSDLDDVFAWFLKLFERMLEHAPQALKAYAINWSTKDRFFFRKLKLFALNKAELFSAEEAARTILALDQEAFWDTQGRRELLFLLRDRWKQFSDEDKIALGDRILAGPGTEDTTTTEDQPSLQVRVTVYYAQWLYLHGVTFSTDQMARLAELVSLWPEWQDEWADNIVRVSWITTGWVQTIESSEALVDVPDTEVIAESQRIERSPLDRLTENKPFIGLVKEQPKKALAALSHETQKTEPNYPIQYWEHLLYHWPEGLDQERYKELAELLVTLPSNIVQQLRFSVGRWLQVNFAVLHGMDSALAWTLFDHVAAALASDKGRSTESALSETTILGQPVTKSRRTHEHALNAPIGEMTEGWIRALNDQNRTKGQGIPEAFKERAEALFSMPGEGGDHAVIMLAREIGWLHFLDSAWVMDQIVPWFDLGHEKAEPAWNGILVSNNLPPEPVRQTLKPILPQLFPKLYEWHWDHRYVGLAAQWVVNFTVFHQGEPGGLTWEQARQILCQMKNEERQTAVFHLSRVGTDNENGWEAYVIPFIDKAWPKELRFRTPSLSASWLSLLRKTDNSFSSVLNSVMPFLISTENLNLHLFYFAEKGNNKSPITMKYPAEVLDMVDTVIPEAPQALPYGLAQVLELIADQEPKLVGTAPYLRLINLVESR